MRALFAILFFSVILTSCKQNDNVEDNQFFVQEDISDKDRLDIITDSLEKDPSNIELWIEQGELCKENLDFKCALNAGAKAFNLDSTNLEARELYAWTLINKPNAPISDVEAAQRHYAYILSITPNDPKTLVEYANTFSLTGDFKTALTHVNEALRIDERYRDAYVLKGSIYRILENNEIALSSYQTAVQLDPDFFMGHLQIGWLLTKLENHQLALEYYENAVDLMPENLNAIYGVAKSLQDLGKYDEALVEYRKLARIDSDFYIAYFNQAFIKQHYQNELDSASYYYGKVVNINPNYVSAWYQLGETYISREMYENAADAISEALKLDKDFEPARDAANRLRDKFYN